MALVEQTQLESQAVEVSLTRPRPFTRAALDAEIAELHASNARPQDVRPLVIERFRRALEDGRAVARAELETGGGGCECTQALSNLQDNLIGAIHEYVVRYLHPPASPADREQMTIAAVRLIRSMNGAGDPKESMTAAGLRSKARSRSLGCFARLHVINPTPKRAFDRSSKSSSRTSHFSSP